MAADDLSYWDYLKEAFRRPLVVPGLGSVPVNQLGLAAFGVLGLLSPGFLLLGVAVEVGYLTWMSSNPRFQKLVRAERLQQAKKGWEEQLGETLDRLSPGSQARYRRLLEESRRALGLSTALDRDDLAATRQLRAGGINQMLWIFVRLLGSREVLVQTLEHVRRHDLEAEIASLGERLAQSEEGSALARSLSGTLQIQQRRLENLTRAERSLAVVDAELERIEHHVVLIREESALGGGDKAGALSSRLDAVSGALTETDRWMEENADILADIGTEPLHSAPAALPDLPAEGVEVPEIPEVARRGRGRVKE
jgi:exonuclease VII small subunit